MPSFYIVLEKKLPDIDVYVNGHSLSKYNEQIEAIAKRAGVTPLMDFFSASPDELAALGVEMDKAKAPREEWFTAEEGLRTVNALLGNLGTLQEKRVEEDLREFQRLLEFAKAKGVRWHLAVDY